MKRYPPPKFIVWDTLNMQATTFCQTRPDAENACGHAAARQPGIVFVVLPVGPPVAQSCQDLPPPAPVTKLD